MDFLGSTARIGLSWLGRRRLPQISGTLTLPGLQDPVEVIRDRWGVPHIYATNQSDLFIAQGFVHAQDRLFQMDLNRRTAEGRLSELFGALALDTDRAARTFGFARLGLIDWASAQEGLRQAILAYTDGVNAFLNQMGGKIPIEYTLLGTRPEAWQPEDTAALGRFMIWQLSHAWYSEIVRARLIQALGSEHAAELEIHYPKQNPVTLPVGIEANRPDPVGKFPRVGGPFLKRGLGSNVWAVSGARTEDGHAYLCNDMHLALGTPALWYINHLVAGNLHVSGVSLPGVPMVLVGHNAHIAWGMTLAFTDCEDLFIDQFDLENPNRYRFQDAWREAEVISERINVKGKTDPHVEEVIVTHHGPVISDAVGFREQRVAISSMALRPSQAVQGWYSLNQAQNWDEFVGAMRLIEAPQLCVGYADSLGNVGNWITGKVPIRLNGDGSLPAPGWTGEYEWVGEVPFEEMPHALNPERGFVLNTNNRIIQDDYPYFLGNVWMNGYRARRITDYFESKGRLTPADFQAMHVDFTSLPGMEFVACLDGMQSDDPDVHLALELLRGWDGQLSPRSVGGTIYEVARYHLVRLLFESALGEELTLQFMGQGFNPVLLASSEFYGHDTVVLLLMLNNPDSWWVQQAGGRDTLLSKGLKRAVEWLRSNLGEDPKSWEWGKLHKAVFPHPLGLQKPLDLVFNNKPVPIGGDTDTPCQTAMHPDHPYDNSAWAPSFRQIVDMSDLAKSQVIVPPGQSGQLGSQHYSDLIGPWLHGEYLPMLWTREQVEEHAEGKLVLCRS
jgi:penicillin amidase